MTHEHKWLEYAEVELAHLDVEFCVNCGAQRHKLIDAEEWTDGRPPRPTTPELQTLFGDRLGRTVTGVAAYPDGRISVAFDSGPEITWEPVEPDHGSAKVLEALAEHRRQWANRKIKVEITRAQVDAAVERVREKSNEC